MFLDTSFSQYIYNIVDFLFNQFYIDPAYIDVAYGFAIGLVPYVTIALYIVFGYVFVKLFRWLFRIY